VHIQFLCNHFISQAKLVLTSMQKSKGRIAEGEKLAICSTCSSEVVCSRRPETMGAVRRVGERVVAGRRRKGEQQPRAGEGILDLCHGRHAAAGDVGLRAPQRTGGGEVGPRLGAPPCLLDSCRRPRPDPPPPIRGLWRGRRCSRSSPPPACVSTRPCWNSDSAPLAARRPPRPYARRPSLPAWPGEGGRQRGGEQGERGL
jgi:hypothetical protein